MKRADVKNAGRVLKLCIVCENAWTSRVTECALLGIRKMPRSIFD